ncbi:MAG TPA: hypothetical protein VF490_22405 [Chryseosolibacter sp.]
MVKKGTRVDHFSKESGEGGPVKTTLLFRSPALRSAVSSAIFFSARRQSSCLYLGVS